MKRIFAILIAGLIAGALVYGVVYRATAPAKQAAPELAWLKTEYQLSDAEFARIYEMHHAYLPRCKAMCRRIDAKNAELQQLLANATGLTPEIERVMRESAELRLECQQAMLNHFFEVSRTMPPEQGKKYLAWVQRQTILATNGMAMQP